MEEIKVDNKITVLSRTFNSEEERRSYFREELRKKLPELKQMEGFPIGEDDDILKLSDPPYYTACPNPWLNDFIAEWEEEKKQLEKEGKRVADFVVDEPYAADVSEGKNNPIYNAHSYHTKVPHPAIMRYLMHYTQPGDIVFDGFAGTGMTGLAASLCGKPNSELKLLIQANNKKDNWGKRNAICGDLSPIASHIASAYNYQPENLVLKIKEFQTILSNIENETSWVFKTTIDGITREINFIVWTEIFLCKNCNHEINFWTEGIENNSVKDVITCPSCGVSSKKNDLKRSSISKYDRVSQEVIKQPRREIAFINFKSQKGLSVKSPSEKDIEIDNEIYQLDYNWFPTEKIMGIGANWGDSYRSGYHEGMFRSDHFHFDRSLYVLSKLYSSISHDRFFRFLFTASLTNLQRTARYKFGRSGNVPLSGTLYVSSLQTETNPFRTIRNKVNSIKKILNTISKNKNVVQTNSATTNKINDNTIDYIFTDPPFGGNLMYSELNFIWESWIKVRTNVIEEAIENKSQNKSTFEYQLLMNSSFKEFHRILKPGKWMTVEFSNTSAIIWNAIQVGLQNNGFIVANVSGLDKKQGSYKALMSPTAVKQDLVISCYKPSSEFDQKFKQHQNTAIAVWDFVEEHLNHLPIHLVKDNATTAIIERSPKILFDRLIAFYVQKSLPVPIDAGAFQKGLRERFIDRDGMFFTNEQVQEYDKKKAENPEFIQLSILVSSEQDGVLWLKNVLTEKSLAYQDIQPLWMQALAGVRKGDVIPELADILEENFLKDEQGKWYVPDPENEVDLEKLRTKRLLKQFEVYKTEATKPKGKIKEVRVEALRAGFKQSYQDKDFKTIVQIGGRIPNNLLMEDEVLLQFYDIASSRV